MTSQTTGIQHLLAAEKKAAEKVSEARKRKAKRLKQAKDEAQAEIEAYRQEREREYHNHETSIMGSRGDMELKMESTTKVKIEEMNKRVLQNKQAAMKHLLELVCDIKPELHINFKAA